MELTSPKFKSLAVTAGASFWFFIITTASGFFSLEIFVLFIAITMVLTQIFAVRISGALDIFAMINTKIFLGLVFIFLIVPYGILFKMIGIDLLRLKKQKNSYWLDMEQLKESRIFKQY
jgi:hypothetical protein